jgi:hypothetical protein
MSRFTLRLGSVTISRPALRLVPLDAIKEMLRRHRSGDFGPQCSHEVWENKLAARVGLTVYSQYPVQQGWVWIITDASRQRTQVMLPSEYCRLKT